MADYKSMYYRLFNRVADAITILQTAHQEGENAFVESQNDTVIRLAEKQDESEDS
ncbi:MAG: hypothetical protein FWE32_04195 [Oscillospiraceae bacterium]|nr:hypothetical protein [Oscillospiraceae bacterium]